jgi:large subunit ribosomal protein L25
MSTDTISLDLQTREEHGKKLAKLRAAGMVPAIVYERGKDSIPVKASYVTMLKAFQKAGKHHPVELTIDGKKHLAMIQTADIEPVKHTLRHVSFHAVNRNETVSAEVAVHLDGQAPAERLGLIIIHPIDHIEIEALPSDLLDEIKVDPSSLQAEGDKITVADLHLPKTVTVITEADRIIAMVEVPRAAVEAETEAETPAATEVPSDHGDTKTE